jgi:hypothetical protein
VKGARWLERGLIMSPLYLSLCTTERQFHQQMRHIKIDRADWPPFLSSKHANATAHIFDQNGKCTAIVCIHPAPERDQLEVVGLVVHEAVHVWQEVLAHIGEHRPSAEFEAYSVQSLAQVLLGEYRRQVYGDPA